nr:helicase-related protein [Nitratidesulfovibrio sp. HK-II]GBO97051.1 DEAD-DEAH box helicase domain protein VrlS [Nitratidesulfovibrio sp. HK-II]
MGQVTRSLLALLKKAQLSTPVRCVPIPLDPEAKSGCIYVLTQERLISLLQSFTKNQTINIMIVDEAQSVGDGSRGVLLQTAIESVRRLNPQVNIFFASPLTRNPGLLLDHFGTGVSKKILEEKHSPVLQNIILARDVHREVKQAEFFVLDDIGEHSIGRAVLSFKFRGTLSEIKSNFAKNVTKHNESAIIYCNTPSQTEETALEICSTSEDDADQDVYDFLEFIREHIHEEYSLINTLPKGVAYHYGSMPNIVRSRIEQLAKQGKLKYICCTSTLLQGINLPAKHIIIDRPRKGKTKPMGRADFLNLAGRAGRLLHEFQGNVWCLRPDTWDTPEGVSDPCFRGADTQDIKMSFFESLSNDGELLLNILRDSHSGDKESFELGVATICKLFSEFIIPGINLPSAYAKSPEAALILENLQNECKKTDFTIPKEILSLNPSVHPVRLQNLYNHMIQQNPIDLLPIYPQNKGANDRLKEIFRIISIYLEKEDNNSFKFDSWLANSWLHDTPLKSIIDQRITYLTQKAQRENKEPPVTKIEINSILDSLQQRIRFKYVKNIRAYKQILTHQLINTGKHKEAAEIIPIDLYLECGSSNPIILSLMGIGLTRTTALMLKGKVKFPDSPTPETCLGLLASTNITSLNIPGVCKNEIEELLSVGS